MTQRRVELGLRENLGQFSLLIAVNAFVGAMVGLERSVLPLLGEVKVTSALAFDTGVYLVVVGLVLMTLRAIQSAWRRLAEASA